MSISCFTTCPEKNMVAPSADDSSKPEAIRPYARFRSRRSRSTCAVRGQANPRGFLAGPAGETQTRRTTASPSKTRSGSTRSPLGGSKRQSRVFLKSLLLAGVPAPLVLRQQLFDENVNVPFHQHRAIKYKSSLSPRTPRRRSMEKVRASLVIFDGLWSNDLKWRKARARCVHQT